VEEMIGDSELLFLPFCQQSHPLDLFRDSDKCWQRHFSNFYWLRLAISGILCEEARRITSVTVISILD